MPLLDKIQNKTAVIGVVGLGYVGLPLAIAFAEAGFYVIGIDADQSKLEAVCRCESYVGDVCDDRLKTQVSEGRLRVSSPTQPSKADIFIICVPTPIAEDKKPDLSHIKDAINQVKKRLASRDSMIVLESSTYPGTTRDYVLPRLSEKTKYVAYSPERVDPGNREFSIRNTPKLVGGIDKESTELATLLYEQIVDEVIPVATVEVAETTKLYENVFRSVNIALANEMALICGKIGVSVWDVIDAAATKPFGFMPFYPGPGVSGHCLPVDPYYLADKATKRGASTDLIHLALGINEDMPDYVACQIIDLLLSQGKRIEGAKILVLGVAFKRNVSDTRESAPAELMQMLLEHGADVLYNDPYVPRLSERMVSKELCDELLGTADCVVIATDHSCYDWRWIVDKAKLVFDTRNATKAIDSDKIYRLGELGQ